LPPVNFTGMSEEAIRAMEGIELAHVQTRIQCLRNVRTLLDASMIQMQQYMNIVSTQRFALLNYYFFGLNLSLYLNSNMENGTRLLNNLNTDVDQVLSSSNNINSTNSIFYFILEINHHFNLIFRF
jgi:hypothetical protein